MEVWKDIDGYEGFYQVSNEGRVKGLVRKVNSRSGCRVVAERILSQWVFSSGYLAVTLKSYGLKKSIAVHRLIALAFIPNPENKPEVNHIDGNKLNNDLSNLEWNTSSENTIHAYETGLQNGPKGSINGMSKLTEEQVKEIKYGNKGSVFTQIAKKYGISTNTVSYIRNGVRWKHV